MTENGNGQALTPREVRLCREAFAEGAADVWDTGLKQEYYHAAARAARRYPMPTVEVPRVVEVETVQVRFVDGSFEVLRHDGQWKETRVYQPATIQLLADLIHSPTEQRPADEVTP